MFSGADGFNVAGCGVRPALFKVPRYVVCSIPMIVIVQAFQKLTHLLTGPLVPVVPKTQ
jgi:hypothetical protein